MATKELAKVHIKELISMAGFEIVKGTVKPIEELKKERLHDYLREYIEDYEDKVGQPCYYLVDNADLDEIQLILIGDKLTKKMQIEIFDDLTFFMTSLMYDDVIYQYVTDEKDKEELLHNESYENLCNYLIEKKLKVNDFDMAWLRIIGLGELDLLSEEEC